MRQCPKCRSADLEPEVRGHDNRSVQAVVYLVCRVCGYEDGPYAL
jgi:hypothetical protein